VWCDILSHHTTGSRHTGAQAPSRCAAPSGAQRLPRRRVQRRRGRGRPAPPLRCAAPSRRRARAFLSPDQREGRSRVHKILIENNFFRFRGRLGQGGGDPTVCPPLFHVGPDGVPALRVWRSRSSCLAFPLFVFGVPALRVWRSRSSCLAFPLFVFGVPVLRVWRSRSSCLAFPFFVFGVPALRVWRSRSSCLAFPLFVFGVPVLRVRRSRSSCSAFPTRRSELWRNLLFFLCFFAVFGGCRRKPLIFCDL